MGIDFLKLFQKNKKINQIKDPINNYKKEDEMQFQFEENQLNLNEENQPLCLKIYLCGKGKGRHYLIDYFFKDKITDKYLKSKADKEFKNDQFHWILSICSDEELNNEICEKIKEDINKDRNEQMNENNIKISNYQIILYFGENLNLIDEYLSENFNPRIIVVTKSKLEIDLINIDKRNITNIIIENMEETEICSQIISTLWEFDCYFNERGNKLCRYSPEKIFKGLEMDNSLFSINILLTGLARVGKSTLINLLSRKMVALETDDNTSVTKKISEYFIYKDDNKNEHAAIKLIDTPGFVPNSNSNIEKQILNMIKNNKNQTDITKQIHFIFFIIMEGNNSLEGNNIKKLFQSFKESNCPVFFIFNKIDEDEEEEFFEEKIKNINEFLSTINCKDLFFKDDNCFIKANFKEEEIEKIYGIDKIYEKILEYIYNKKILDKEIKKKMDCLIKDFRKIESDEIFISQNEEDVLNIKNLKSDIVFNERMTNIKSQLILNPFFSKINIDSIIINGRLTAKECKKIIIPLVNLKEILSNISNDIPLVYIFQAFMVKEIGIAYGLNINSLNYGLKLLKMNLTNIIDDSRNKNKNDNIREELNLDDNRLYENIESIISMTNNLLEKSNKKLILQLSNFLKNIAEFSKDLDNFDNFNLEFINIIEEFCLMFFEKEIIESDGLTLMVNYYNKLNYLVDDIKEYAVKD